ncbi:MAG: S53 family peptidase [Terriglobales bacterium]
MQRELTGSSLFRLAMVAVFFCAAFIPAAAQDRIAHSISASEPAQLHGNVHPLARAENDQGAADASMMLYRMVLTFQPSATQHADLEALLAEQQNPLSPYYRQWLTPEQYADRFGISANDMAKVAAWLQAQGFTVDESARSRTYIAFSGSSSQVESAFHTSIHRFLVDGEPHFANVSDPALPWSLANVALGIHGLNDFRLKPRGSVQPRFTSSISGNHFLVPDDFATIYDLKPLYDSGLDGSGQKIAVMGQTDLIMSDISTFRSLSGLPPNTPTVVLVPGSSDPGVVNGDIGEANLDVQWSGAVARNATIVYVNSKNGAFDSMNYAVSQNIAPVISISYGDCEAHFSQSEITGLVAMGQQANAQGQTIVGPSGDSGAADCDFPPNSTTKVTSATHGLAVDVPAALPYVTGVGGTTFNDGSGSFWSATNNANNGSALSYIPEVAWNDTALEISSGGSLAATGGGVSKLFSKPVWQVGAGVPNDGQRDVPDISFNASFDHDGYLMCSQGSCVNGYRQANNNLTVVGGTSAGVPTFAGMVALANQYVGGVQGNVNPRLYQLASSTPSAFHDVTSGDNKVPCTSGTTNCPSGTTSIGFTAGVGYDQVTGLGSVDAGKLVPAWSSPATFLLSNSPSSLTLTAGPSSNVGTTTLSVSPQNGFNGTVALSCTVPSSLSRTTCSVSPSALTGSGSATVTVTAPTTRTSLREPRLFPHLFPWTDGTFAIAFGMMLVGKRDGVSKKWKAAIFAVLLVVVVGGMVGCGGGGSSSSTSSFSQSTSSSVTGTAAVTVTATSGSFTRTANINVTVQ